MPVTMLVKLDVKPGQIDEACAALLSVRPDVLNEEGCIQYDFYRVDGDDTTLFAHEIWADEDALAAHSKAPHMDGFREKLMPTLAGGLDVKKLIKLHD